MDATTIEKVSEAVNGGNYYLDRAKIEQTERWREIAGEMPFLRFPPSWEVSVTPPFAGAVARFRVRKGRAEVSVYADFYERLGCWAEPHWEIYPDAHGDNARFSIATESTEMLAAIGKSLRKQLRDSDTRPKAGDAKQGSTRRVARAEGIAQPPPN